MRSRRISPQVPKARFRNRVPKAEPAHVAAKRCVLVIKKKKIPPNPPVNPTRSRGKKQQLLQGVRASGER